MDPPREILVTKLCALLSRSELRDLEDVRALLDAGGDLVGALADAPRKEAGFSPVALAWVLEQLPVAAMGRAVGRAPEEIRGLEAFRRKLVGEILVAAKPDRARPGGPGGSGTARGPSAAAGLRRRGPRGELPP